MKILAWIGAGVFVLFTSLLFWGSAIEPRFLLQTRTYDIELPHLPAAWVGHKVALLSDFQTGMWLDNTGMVRSAVEKALEAHPALVLIAGDFVYQADSARVMEAVDLVRPLIEARVPVVAVFGNHDYGMMDESAEPQARIAGYLKSRLESIGLRVIENESVQIEPPSGGPPLHVVGVGSVWAGRSRPLKALAELPADAPRMVLMHNPVSFLDLPPNAAPLALAAHTHGGQICLPNTPSKSWLRIARPHEVIADGWAQDSIGAPGNRLYVNRGIGFSLAPLRINCRPELTLFTLRRENSEP